MPYPKHPRTIGEHLLKKRLESGLIQKDVAKSIRVAIQTIIGWEKGRSMPEVRYYPAIIAFLGYDPSPTPKTLGEKIVAWRRRNGISRKALAKQLGIDEATLGRREKDIASTRERKAVELTKFLEEQFGDVSDYVTETDP